MIEITPELPLLSEIVRIPSPAPKPQSLAHDGEFLWVGSWQTDRVYGIDPKQGRLVEEAAAPGKPVGSACTGEELRFVLSENGEDDNRFIRRFVPGHGFKSREAYPCPEDTGSFLAFDGSRLWLTQRFSKRALELDGKFAPIRRVDVGEEIIGAAWVGSRLYFSLWLGSERGGCRIAYAEPNGSRPGIRYVAKAPFVAISLAHDGDRFWTNDFKDGSIVAFAIPQ